MSARWLNNVSFFNKKKNTAGKFFAGTEDRR
jgi:hypothetical protein